MLSLKSRALSRTARPWLAGLLIVTLVAGCPDMSSREMAKYAIKRKKDEDEEETKPRPPVPAPTHGPAAAAPQTPSTAAPNTSGGPLGNKVPPQGAGATNSAAPPSSSASPAPTPAPPSSAATLTDRMSMPETPWSEAQRFSHTVSNLRKLGEAVELYRQQYGAYPPRAIYSGSGEPLLSWRVALLPLMGYQQLYDQFYLDEPWDSIHNRQLLDRIPKVYQSPERWNETTNYLAPIGASTLFNGDRGVHPRRVEDGLDRTVVFLEVDDAAAVPWTEPRDWDFDGQQPTRQLGGLRNKGFLALWGSGSVRLVNLSSGPAQIKSIFTVDGGEPLQLNQISQSAESALAKLDAGTSSTPATATSVDGSATAPGGASSSAGSGASTQPVAGAELRQSIDDLLARGLENEAAKAYFAWLLMQPATGAWTDEFAWSPALKRPVALMRIGIGIDFTGRESREARLQLAQANQRLGSASGGSPRELAAELLSKTLGSAGSDLLRVCTSELVRHPKWMAPGSDGLPGPTTTKPTDLYQPLRLGPGLELLGVDSTERLFQLCDRSALDVALIVQLRDPPGGKSQLRAMRVTVWDVAGRRELYRTRAVKASDRMAAQNDALKDDPWPPIRDELGAWLAENFQTVPLPTSLRPEHIQKRAERLAAKPKPQPLMALAELKFYHARGLLDLEQLLKSFQQLTDESTGLTLVAGDPSARQTVLQRWLSPEPSQETVLQVSRERDDD